MRRSFVLLATCLAPACTSVVLADPRILVSPYYANYQVRGNVALQSEGLAPGDPPQDNAPQDMRNFGQDRHRDDLGVRIDLGDGFGGLRIDYLNLDMSTSRTGVLTDDWGELLAGDSARMSVRADELRVGWIEPVVDVRAEYREQPIRMRFGAGALVAWRDMDMTARTEDGSRSQRIDLKGTIVYPAIRFAATWRDFGVDLDYAISPEVALSGDYTGVLHDFEVRTSYRLPQRDVTLFAGYRYSVQKAEGRAGALDYDADLRIDGFQFGLSVTF